MGVKFPSVRVSVRPSVHKKVSSISMTDVMRDAQRYDLDPDPRSRSRAHESPKFDHFQGLSPPPFIMGAGK